MFENIINFFKKLGKKEKKESSNTAKERLHLVLMQDRANVSADFLELMKQEIIEVIKKYIDIDEKSIDVKLTNKTNEDGTVGAPALYANIPIITIKNDARKLNVEKQVEDSNKTSKNEAENKETVDSQTQDSNEQPLSKQSSNENVDKNSEESNLESSKTENKEPSLEENKEENKEENTNQENIKQETEQTEEEGSNQNT